MYRKRSIFVLETKNVTDTVFTRRLDRVVDSIHGQRRPTAVVYEPPIFLVKSFACPFRGEHHLLALNFKIKLVPGAKMESVTHLLWDNKAAEFVDFYCGNHHCHFTIRNWQ